MTPAALLSLLLAATPAAAHDEQPSSLRWRPTAERAAPPIELGAGRFRVVLDGTARRTRLRVAQDAGTALAAAATLEVDLAGEGPTQDEERQLHFREAIATTTWRDSEKTITQDLFVSERDGLGVLRLRCEGGALALRVRWSGGVGRSQLETVGGRVTATEGDGQTVEGALAVVIRFSLGEPVATSDAAPERKPFQELLDRHLAARAERRGGFTLELGAPDDQARWRATTTDERLRLLRDGVDDPDLAAAWIDLARHRPFNSLPCSRYPPDLAAALAQLERRDGDAAWAALRPRVATRLEPLLGPCDDERSVDLEASALLLRLLVDERVGVEGAGEAARLSLLSLLPALPRTWSDGLLTGVRTASGVVVDLSWSDGALAAARLASPVDTTLRVDPGRGDFELVEIDEKGALLPPRSAPRMRDGGERGALELAAKAGRPLVLQHVRE
jgi:hypothetical protein